MTDSDTISEFEFIDSLKKIGGGALQGAVAGAVGGTLGIQPVQHV